MTGLPIAVDFKRNRKYFMIVKNTELDYCMAHSSSPPDLLVALDRETHLKTLSPQMQSGAYQGLLLRFISQMMQPERILEIGTFSGYGTLCLAEGLKPSGQMHTIEVNDELAWLIKKYIALAGLENRVTLHIGDAADIIPQFTSLFDLIFLDAGKLDYERHYQLLMPLLKPGGFLLADNVLWDGKVAGMDEKDETARALRRFNQMIQDDPRVENLLLPLRDGLMLVRKR